MAAIKSMVGDLAITEKLNDANYDIRHRKIQYEENWKTYKE